MSNECQFWKVFCAKYHLISSESTDVVRSDLAQFCSFVFRKLHTSSSLMGSWFYQSVFDFMFGSYALNVANSLESVLVDCHSSKLK